jgi:hypothetical protein
VSTTIEILAQNNRYPPSPEIVASIVAATIALVSNCHA